MFETSLEVEGSMPGEGELTLCSVMAFWKPLYLALASKDAKDVLDSSKAITSWPRAAAASEK